MKRIFAYFMLAAALVLGGATVVNAQTKDQKKAAKKAAKQMKKDGWELVGAVATLEEAVLKYRVYMEADEDNRIALTGLSVGKSLKNARNNAVNDGITNYAIRAKAQVVGKLKSIASTDASNEEAIEEIDKFGAAFESGVNTKISGLVKQHFVLKRVKSNGVIEVTAYMSIDEKAAKKAREEAALEAKRKAQLNNLSEEVEKFIGEPVPGDE